MSSLILTGITAAAIPAPSAGKKTIFIDVADGFIKAKDSTGAVEVLSQASLVAYINAHISATNNPHNVTKAQVGLGNVDNTSDLDKPVSTQQAAAIADAQTNAEAYADGLITNLVGTSPTALDTIQEIAAALGNNPAAITDILTALGLRLRVDTAAQGLSGAQKTNAKTNIDLQNVDNTSDANKPLSIATIAEFAKIQNLNNVTGEPTGFPNRTDSNISFNNTTRTFTIAPVGAAFDYYINGVKYTVGTKTLTIPNTSGTYFLALDTNGNLVSFTSFTDLLFKDYAYVANFYWSVTQGKILGLGEERHGLTMDWATHSNLHRYVGARIRPNEFTIGNFNLGGSGSNNNEAQASINNGGLADEDIEMLISHAAVPANPFEQILTTVAKLPFMYKLGSGEWQVDAATDYLVKQGTARIKYNLFSGGTWTTPDASELYHVAVWVFATNYQNEPIRCFLGQRQDALLVDARANNTYESLNLSELPIQECKVLYRLIFQTSSAYTNVHKARLVEVLDLRKTIDQGQVVTQVTDHGQLSGLGGDHHQQYHNDTRGDARYYTKALLDGGQLDSRYYTEAEITSLLANKYDTTNPAGYQTAAQVAASIAALVNSSPAALDTLSELATALGNDPNFATTITNALATKEPTIAAGTNEQYWRGDKTWQDLPAAVRAAVLTGLDITDPSEILATDSVLSALGKLQAQVNVWTELTQLADQNNNSAVTFSALTDLGMNVVAGKTYYFEYTLLFKSTAANTGIGLTINGSGLGGEISAIVNIPIAADGTAALYSGSITSFGDTVTGTSVQTANTTFVANIKGVFKSTANGTFYPLFRSEIGGNSVSIRAGSVALIREF